MEENFLDIGQKYGHNCSHGHTTWNHFDHLNTVKTMSIPSPVLLGGMFLFPFAIEFAFLLLF